MGTKLLTVRVEQWDGETQEEQLHREEIYDLLAEHYVNLRQLYGQHDALESIDYRWWGEMSNQELIDFYHKELRL
jgi:hypothetical protein